MTTSSTKKAWQEYLSADPSTEEIAGLFFLNQLEGLNSLAWEELKSRNDIEKEHLLEVVVHCSEPKWIRQDAWETLNQYHLEERDIEKIISRVQTSDPIVKDIIKKYGTNKKYLLQKVKETLM